MMDSRTFRTARGWGLSVATEDTGIQPVSIAYPPLVTSPESCVALVAVASLSALFTAPSLASSLALE